MESHGFSRFQSRKRHVWLREDGNVLLAVYHRYKNCRSDVGRLGRSVDRPVDPIVSYVPADELWKMTVFRRIALTRACAHARARSHAGIIVKYFVSTGRALFPRQNPILCRIISLYPAITRSPYKNPYENIFARGPPRGVIFIPS